MNRKSIVMLAAVLFGVLFLLDGNAFAQDDNARFAASFGRGLPAAAYFIGLGIAAFGAALGLSKAVAMALESIARQPEAANDIRGAMILGCAFIEALAIYALISPILAGIGGLV